MFSDSKQRPLVTVADLPPGSVPAPDLKLQLRIGEIVETYAHAVCMGSPVLCHAMELEPGAVIPIPLDVSAEGMKMALDELLPPFLLRNSRPAVFNPLHRAHRDYVRSLEYLQVPNHERLLAQLPKEEKFIGATSATYEDDLDAFNFILQHHGPLTANVERLMWEALETRSTHCVGRFLNAALCRCRQDPDCELAETVRQVMGRAVVAHAKVVPTADAAASLKVARRGLARRA